MRIFFYFLFVFAVTVEPARAHFGHLGELAGHGHWVAAGVLVAGGLAAAWLAGLKDRDEEEDVAEETPADEVEETA